MKGFRNLVFVSALMAAGLLFAPAGSAGVLTPGTVVTSDGATRHLLLYTPDSELGAAGPKGKLPLVLVFHGLRLSAQQMADSGSGQIWKKAADGLLPDVGTGGFYVAFLNGSGQVTSNGPATLGTWNDCEASRFNNVSTANDVEFVRAVVGKLSEVKPDGTAALIDSSRVYSYGISNGAGMALRLGREAGDVVAAIAAIANVDPAAANDECPLLPPRRPALIVHGTADLLIPYTAPRCLLGGCRRGHLETVEIWRTGSEGKVQNALPTVFAKSLVTARPAGTAADTTRIACTQYVRKLPAATTPPANVDVRVEACTVTGGGHLEPSILTYVGAVGEAIFGKQNNDAESVVQAWKFFRRHQKGK